MKSDYRTYLSIIVRVVSFRRFRVWIIETEIMKIHAEITPSQESEGRNAEQRTRFVL